MTAPEFMDRARALDADIQAIDRRFLIARVNHAPPRTLVNLEARRNALVKAWGEAWATKPVSAGLHDAAGDSSTDSSSHSGESEPSP